MSPRVNTLFSLNTFCALNLRAGLCMVLLGLTTLLAGCSSTAKHKEPTPSLLPKGLSDSQGVDPRAQHPKRNDVVLLAMSLLDSTYRWGGRGPATGFDCSGLVSHVYQEAAGLLVQGNAAELGRKSRPIDRSQMQAGDLLFFNTLGARHSHVGIYVGGGRFVHASNPRTGVRIDLLSNRYYAQRFEGAGTLLD
jgi:cell wall-associated NlpC family hydrolase